MYAKIQVIKIKLSALKRDGNLFKRTKECFQDRYSGDLDFLYSKLDNTSINLPEGINATRVNLSKQESLFENVKIPRVNSLVNDISSSAIDLLEWIGMVAVESDRISAADRVDPFMSTYEVPRPLDFGDLHTLRISGLLAPLFILDCVSKIKQSDLDWCVVVVSGFSDSPVTWNKQENESKGHNDFVIVISKEKDVAFRIE